MNINEINLKHLKILLKFNLTKMYIHIYCEVMYYITAISIRIYLYLMFIFQLISSMVLTGTFTHIGFTFKYLLKNDQVFIICLKYRKTRA